MEDIVETVLKAMSTVKKPQRKFMQTLLAVLMVFHFDELEIDRTCEKVTMIYDHYSNYGVIAS